MARVRERRRKRTERRSVELKSTAAMMGDELCTTPEEQSVQYWQAYAELSMMMRRSFQWANTTVYMHAHVARPATRPVKLPFQPQEWTSNIAYSKGRLKTRCPHNSAHSHQFLGDFCLDVDLFNSSSSTITNVLLLHHLQHEVLSTRTDLRINFSVLG